MFKIAVLGAGCQAQAVAHYLLHDPRCSEFVCYDYLAASLMKCEKFSGNKGRMCPLEMRDDDKLIKRLRECDGVINTLPYALLPETTCVAIIAGKSAVDLGGNDEVVEKQKAMHELAVHNGVTVVPACGLAPGIISDLAFYLQKMFGAEKLEMYCGGLPQKPEGELNHSIFFNVQGLYNEYAERPMIIENGKPIERPALWPENDIIFNTTIFNGRLESALTHGAFDADPNFWEGARDVFYATLRYANHFGKVRIMLQTLSREECVNQFQEKMPSGGNDLIVTRVIASKDAGKKSAKAIAEIIDFYDEKTGLSAMQRCTAFPATETLLQILAGGWPKGIVRHEPYVDMAKMISALSYHKLRIWMRASAKGEFEF